VVCDYITSQIAGGDKKNNLSLKFPIISPKNRLHSDKIQLFHRSGTIAAKRNGGYDINTAIAYSPHAKFRYAKGKRGGAFMIRHMKDNIRIQRKMSVIPYQRKNKHRQL
jgi:hypothetical protein